MADSDRSALAWLVAVVFMGTTALFAWQYARARGDTTTLRRDYVQLQERLEAQEQRNRDLLDDVSRMQRQLDSALHNIESLRGQIESGLDPAPPE